MNSYYFPLINLSLTLKEYSNLKVGTVGEEDMRAWKYAIQGIALVIGASFAHDVIAGSLKEINDLPDGGQPETEMTSPFNHDITPIPLVPVEDVSPEVVEVSLPPVKPQEASKPLYKGSKMDSWRAKEGAKLIKDETATTGENAKRKLPSSLQDKEDSSSYMAYDVRQTIPNLTLPAKSSFVIAR